MLSVRKAGVATTDLPAAMSWCVSCICPVGWRTSH